MPWSSWLWSYIYAGSSPTSPRGSDTRDARESSSEDTEDDDVHDTAEGVHDEEEEDDAPAPHAGEKEPDEPVAQVQEESSSDEEEESRPVKSRGRGGTDHLQPQLDPQDWPIIDPETKMVRFGLFANNLRIVFI